MLPSRYHVAAITVQVIIGAPPAHHLVPMAGRRRRGIHLAVFAFATLAVPRLAVVVRVVVRVPSLCAPPFHLGAVVLPLGGGFQRMGLGKELLDRMDEMPDAAGALAAWLFCAAGPLVLQGVEAVVVKRQLLLELVQESGGQPVDLAGRMGGRHTLVTGVVLLRCVVHSRKGAATAGSREWFS